MASNNWFTSVTNTNLSLGQARASTNSVMMLQNVVVGETMLVMPSGVLIAKETTFTSTFEVQSAAFVIDSPKPSPTIGIHLPLPLLRKKKIITLIYVFLIRYWGYSVFYGPIATHRRRVSNRYLLYSALNSRINIKTQNRK